MALYLDILKSLDKMTTGATKYPTAGIMATGNLPDFPNEQVKSFTIPVKFDRMNPPPDLKYAISLNSDQLYRGVIELIKSGAVPYDNYIIIGGYNGLHIFNADDKDPVSVFAGMFEELVYNNRFIVIGNESEFCTYYIS